MNQVMLITGASRGIGAATAILAAQRDYAVCINYRQNRAAADAVVDKIRQAGGQAIAVAADIASEQEVVHLFETVDQQLGHLTVLVNNAGILAQQMRVDQMNADRLNRIFTTNITGSFLCAREAIKRMSTRYGGRGGSIINVSSGASRFGSPHEYVDYAASKAAIDTMTIGLAKEVAADGIRVNAVRPGIINTEIHTSSGEPNRVERVKEMIPMQRGGEAIEVATAILWLASNESPYTTGAILDIGGGR